MQDEDRILRAHDILTAVVLREIDADVSPADMVALRGALDVLCWILGHTHNTRFPDSLETIHACLTLRGYRLEKG